MKPVVTLITDKVGMINVYIGDAKFGVFDQIDGKESDYCWFPRSTEKLSGDAIMAIGEKLNELNAERKGEAQSESTKVFAEVHNLFLVSGRVCGDDDDTVHIVSGNDIGDAVSTFEEQLRHDSRYPDENGQVYINTSHPLSYAIDQHI